MFSIVAVIIMGMSNVVAVMPKEVNIPKRKEIKKSRGKGNNKNPYYSKFF